MRISKKEKKKGLSLINAIENREIHNNRPCGHNLIHGQERKETMKSHNNTLYNFQM